MLDCAARLENHIELSSLLLADFLMAGTESFVVRHEEAHLIIKYT